MDTTGDPSPDTRGVSGSGTDPVPGEHTELLDPAVPTGTRSGRFRWVAAAASAAALVLVVGGAAVAVRTLASSGAAPEKFVPANAIALVKVDLDPAAGEKLDAARFLRHFPELRDDVAEGQDFRETLFNVIARDRDELKDVDYAKDVKPWLGDRAARAVLPPSGGSGGDDKPDTEVVLQVTDEVRAEESLRRLIDRADRANRADRGGNTTKDATGDTTEDAAEKTGFVVRDGYAILAEDQARADRFAKAAQGTVLGENPGFQRDMSGFDNGVMAAWVDVHALAKHVSQVERASRPGGAGAASPFSTRDLLDRFSPDARFVSVVRFDAGYAEARGRLSGVARDVELPDAVGGALGKLPEPTVAALGAGGLDRYLPQIWKDVSAGYAKRQGTGEPLDALTGRLSDQYGITLPDDLGTLLGRSLVVGVSAEDLDGAVPQIGFRSVTDPARARSVLAKFQSRPNASQPDALKLVSRTTADGIAVATTEAYARQLAADGSLGRDRAFRTALPDADKADVALWVDPDTFVGAAGDRVSNAKFRENLAHVDAIGLTSGQLTPGTWEYRLRVLAK